MEDRKMTEEISIQEFRDTGMILYINQILQPLGLSLAVEMEDGTPTRMYPIKSKFRGFSEKSVVQAYTRINKYIKNNVDDITDV